MNKFLVACVVLAFVSVIGASHYEDHHHYPPHPYSFKYAVKDPHTGDVKSQYESGHGGFVHGEYSLLEPDGTVRTVKYSADPHNGFTAKVYKSGHASHHGYHNGEGYDYGHY